MVNKGVFLEMVMILTLYAAVFVIVSHAQDQSGFISIDCGLDEPSNYRDDATGLNYRNDANFIDTGESHNIARQYISDSIGRQLWTVRSFPDGRRNCYNLSSATVPVKGNKFLIRATFMYGNYDTKNQTPKFDIHLGVKLWATVAPQGLTSVVSEEIIHVPSSDYLYVCLVNTDTGTPFISALELRPLNQTAYRINGVSLARFVRFNFAPETNQTIRYPEDVYDRIWQPFDTPGQLAALSTAENVNTANSYRPPSSVMRTAIAPRNSSSPLKLSWSPLDPTNEFYVYLHFAEVERLQNNQSRQFYVYLENQRWYNEIVTPPYLRLFTVLATGGSSKATFNYSLVKTENSTLPPIINAMEVYMVKQFLQSQTDENDVLAMANIQSSYGVKRSNWEGDPCLPSDFLWEGLECIVSDNQTIPPRIKFLNLSSSGLTGNVSLYFSNLISLEYLDLSNNGLTGVVPDFLAELPSLEVLNLTGNQFSGAIPQKLLDKSQNGLLTLRMDGYDPCPSGQCKSKRSKKFVVPLAVALGGALFILFSALIIVFWRKHQVRKMDAKSNRRNGMLELKSQQYSYSEILKITNNFGKVLGKGGFGTVYHGTTDSGTQVAVKVLSESSMQGYNEFQTEADLLTRVHHRNLTSLVGYCYEDTNMALVYEYMANGNLRELLFDNSHVLSWLERLQIALDAAQGLDYLHNGCKPPIIHRDVKTTNILLNEKFEAKLADFGLSRVISMEDGSFVSTRVVGTPGYLDPEYYESQRLNEKSDIYSLGIVILELITGRPVITPNGDKRHIVQWVSFLVATGDIKSIVDPRLNGYEFDVNSVWKALEIALNCASPVSFRRPTMAQVLTELHECFEAEKSRIEEEGLTTIRNPEALPVANSEILFVKLDPR